MSGRTRIKAQREYLLVTGMLVLAAVALMVLVARLRDAESVYPGPSTGGSHVTTASGTPERMPLTPVPEESVPAVEITNEPDQTPEPLPRDNADLSEVSAEEPPQRQPVSRAIRPGGKPSEYAGLESLDKLENIMREWHSLDVYHAMRPRNPGPEVVADFLESARALARIRDENWPRANWLLAQLLVDLGNIPESAQVLRGLLNESEFPPDDNMRADAMFRLALMELERPRAYWTEDSYYPDRLLSLTSPGEPAFDVAEKLFMELRDQGSLDARSAALMDDFIAVVRKWRTYASEHPRESLKHARDVLHDPMVDFRTGVVLMRELYATDAHRDDRHRVFRYTEERMPEISSRLAQLPLEERRMWSTDAAWLMLEGIRYPAVKDLLEPLMADGRIWEDVDAYLQAQYYLACAYGSLEQTEQVSAVVQRLANEGFRLEQMEAEQREFYRYLRKQWGNSWPVGDRLGP